MASKEAALGESIMVIWVLQPAASQGDCSAGTACDYFFGCIYGNYMRLFRGYIGEKDIGGV